MRRQEIIDAARSVFAHKGFNNATLEDVAERAEFGKGTLYNYFTNKEALFVSVVEDSFDTVKRIAEEACSLDGSFSEKMEAFIRGELTFFFDNLESIQLMMREAHYLRGRNPLMQLMPQLLTVVADTIAAEQRKRKVLTGADPKDLAMMLVNMLFGQFACKVYRRFGCDTEKGEHPGDLNVTDIFAGITREEIEQEVATSTKLIHTVFFHGVSK
jgi:AcrR family transcriptional regulator